ncbi:hypothetical protein [Sphingobacterium faecium]
MMSFAIIISLNLLSMVAWIFARALKKENSFESTKSGINLPNSNHTPNNIRFSAKR